MVAREQHDVLGRCALMGREGSGAKGRLIFGFSVVSVTPRK